MSIKSQALRFRIWQYAAPREWDVTFPEVAEALGVSFQSVVQAARHAGWLDRFRNLGSHEIEAQGSRRIFLVAKYTAEDIVAGRIGVAP